jgi:hypothetical protein
MENLLNMKKSVRLFQAKLALQRARGEKHQVSSTTQEDEQPTFNAERFGLEPSSEVGKIGFAVVVEIKTSHFVGEMKVRKSGTA